MRPSDAYASVEKGNVRTQLHDEFREQGCKTVLFFPATTRFELDSLLAHDFEPKNLHAVERVSQNLSNFTRLLTPYEKLNMPRYRCSLGDVGAKIRVTIDAANLDFCCNSSTAQHDIQRFIASGVMARESIVAVQVSCRSTERYERNRTIEQSIKDGLGDRGRAEAMWPGSRYWNEATKCVMAYYLYKLSMGEK